MTEAELAAIERRAKTGGRYAASEWDSCIHGAMVHECPACRGDDCRALVAEVRRLRGLVKSAETMGIPMGSETRNCPWCGYAHGDWKRKHSPECPAFTESGDVR